MNNVSRFQVRFEQSGDGQVIASFTAVEKASKEAADKSARHWEEFGRRIGSAIRIVGIAAAAGMALVIKNSIEAEKANAQLEARLKSTGGAAGITKLQLDDLATALARQSTLDDDVIKGAEAMLLTFTRIHTDVFPRALKAILDVSEGMGTDLQSAAVQVGKALNDPIKGIAALTRVGVQFTKDQEKLIKKLVETGKESEAQAVILAELETQFGGAAEAARNTFGGALQALINQLGDLTEGDAGSLKGAKEAVEDLIDTLNDPDVQAGVGNVVAGIFDITEASIRGIAKLGELSAAVGDFFAENQNKSYNALQNKQNELEKQLFQTQRTNRKSLPFLRRDTSELESEIADIERLLQRRRQQKNEDAQVESIRRQIDAAMAPLPHRTPSGGDDDEKKKKTKPKRDLMADWAKEDAAALKRLVDETERATQQFDAMAATLAGPLAEAEQQHKKNLADITELGMQAGRSREEIARAIELENKRYAEQVETIKAEKTQSQELLADMEFELRLLGLSNIEREKAIALRHAGAKATDEERAAIAHLVEQLDTAREAEDALNDVKQAFRNLFEDVLDYTKEGEDAFKHFIDSIRQMVIRLLADAALKQLEKWLSSLGNSNNQGSLQNFGNNPEFTGGSSGGSGGSIWTMLANWAISAFSSGGRAAGGPTPAGQLFEVGEFNRPELYSDGSRSWLIPGNRGGSVTPATGIASQEQKVTVIAVFGEEQANQFVDQRMKSNAGERITVTHFQRNRKVMGQ